jgi:hypothetical protein
MKGFVFIFNFPPKLEEEKKMSLKEVTDDTCEPREQFEFMHSLYEIAKYQPEAWRLHRASVPLAHRPPRVSRGHLKFLG